MDKFIINGGKILHGKLEVSGAKNATLVLMPAAILASGKSVLMNTPELNDVFTMIKLLKHLGAEINFSNHILRIDTNNIVNFIAPYEHVKKMRASVYVLGPLLGRYGEAKVSLPGGCAWGPRPINLHLEALNKMGAEIYNIAGRAEFHLGDLKNAKRYLQKSNEFPCEWDWIAESNSKFLDAIDSGS